MNEKRRNHSSRLGSRPSYFFIFFFAWKFESILSWEALFLMGINNPINSNRHPLKTRRAEPITTSNSCCCLKNYFSFYFRGWQDLYNVNCRDMCQSKFAFIYSWSIYWKHIFFFCFFFSSPPGKSNHGTMMFQLYNIFWHFLWNGCFVIFLRPIFCRCKGLGVKDFLNRMDRG